MGITLVTYRRHSPFQRLRLLQTCQTDRHSRRVATGLLVQVAAATLRGATGIADDKAITPKRVQNRIVSIEAPAIATRNCLCHRSANRARRVQKRRQPGLMSKRRRLQFSLMTWMNRTGMRDLSSKKPRRRRLIPLVNLYRPNGMMTQPFPQPSMRKLSNPNTSPRMGFRISVVLSGPLRRGKFGD